MMNQQVEFVYHTLVPSNDVTLNIGNINKEMIGQLQRLEEELRATATATKDVSGVGSKVTTEYCTLCQAWSEVFPECRSVRIFIPSLDALLQ